MAETCTECRQPLIEVDNRGQHFRCNEWRDPEDNRSRVVTRRLGGAACAAVESIPTIKEAPGGLRPPCPAGLRRCITGTVASNKGTLVMIKPILISAALSLATATAAM